MLWPRRPFEVRIDGVLHDHFYDVRDAMASAKTAKRKKLSSTVVVTDVRTRKLVIEIEGQRLGSPSPLEP